MKVQVVIVTVMAVLVSGGMEEELSDLAVDLSSAPDVASPVPTLNVIQEEIAQLTEKLELAKEVEIRANIEFDEQSKAKQVISKNLEQLFQNVLKPLNSLRRNDIVQLKSMQNPPPSVKLVFAAVCVLKGIKPQEIKEYGKKVMDYWGPSKKMLADKSFLQSLKDFDKDNIPPEVMARLRKDYIRRGELSPRNMSQISSAAARLCLWIRALDDYDKLIKETAPLIKTRLLQVERTLDEVDLVLTIKEQEIQELKEKLAQLHVEFLAGVKNNEELTAEPEPNPSEVGYENVVSIDPEGDLQINRDD